MEEEMEIPEKGEEKSKGKRRFKLRAARIRRNSRRFTRFIDSNPLYLLITKFGKYSGFLLFWLFALDILFPQLIPVQSLWSSVVAMMGLGATAAALKTITVMRGHSSIWMRGPQTPFRSDRFDDVMQNPVVSWFYWSTALAATGALGTILYAGTDFASASSNPVIISFILGGVGGLLIECGKRIYAARQEKQSLLANVKKDSTEEEHADSLGKDPGLGQRALMTMLKTVYISPRQVGWMYTVTLYALLSIEDPEKYQRFLTNFYWTVGSLLTANHFLEELPNTRYQVAATTCCGGMACICGSCCKRREYEAIDEEENSCKDKVKDGCGRCGEFFCGCLSTIKQKLGSCCGRVSCNCLKKGKNEEQEEEFIEEEVPNK